MQLAPCAAHTARGSGRRQAKDYAIAKNLSVQRSGGWWEQHLKQARARRRERRTHPVPEVDSVADEGVQWDCPTFPRMSEIWHERAEDDRR